MNTANSAEPTEKKPNLVMVFFVLVLIATFVATALTATMYMLAQGPRHEGNQFDQTDVTFGEGVNPLAPMYPDDPPINFTFTNQDNESFGTEQLKGKVYAVGFFFARCRGVCAVTVPGIVEIAQAFENDPRSKHLRVVMMSVEPERDTPEALAAFAEAREINPDYCVLLTGDREAIWNTSIDQFKLNVFDAPDNTAMPVSHSEKFALVDVDGSIVGYYSGISPDDRQRLIQDANRLLNRALIR